MDVLLEFPFSFHRFRFSRGTGEKSFAAWSLKQQRQQSLMWNLRGHNLMLFVVVRGYYFGRS